MTITVEFFGIPRARAGVDHVTVFSDRQSAPLCDVLSEVAKLCPDFASACLDGNQLREGFIVSIDGQCFVRDESKTIYGGQSILLLSSDAGG